MKVLSFIVLVSSIAFSQADSGPYPYLLRISHKTFDDYSCALLQENGAFHLEFAHGDDLKVFEGTTGIEDVMRVQRILDRSELATLSQGRIEEPIIRGKTETLQLTIYQQEYWQDLFFQSVESEAPFKRSLEQLVSWLDELHKLPHTEFSEDEGKQNCLPPRKIVLKKRDANPPRQAFTPTDWGVKSAMKVPPLAPTASVNAPVLPLLRAYSVAVRTDDARQFCTIVAGNGQYRFEDRYQKTGSPVRTKITAGVLKPEELSQLRAILDNPALANVRHREPRGSAPVPVLGDMLNLAITRSAGEQNIILSSGFGRQFGTFYGGDADAAVARNLTKFLKDHIENNQASRLDKSARNDCTEAE